MQVAIPGGAKDTKSELRNWDLWGPLILCLVLAILLSTGAGHHEVKGKAADDQSTAVFASVFVIVWIGAAVVTVNAVLLGAPVSFFQSICVLGYCIFPLTIAAFVCLCIGWSGCLSPMCTAIRLGVVGVTLVWSTQASLGFLQEVVPVKRAALAAYPVYLFYIALAWIIVIRSSP